MGGDLIGGDPALLRRINAVAVLRILRAREPLTVTQIAAATGLSRRTTEAVIDDLVVDRWVGEVLPDQETRRVGRPARSFRFRAERGHVMGIDIGAYHVLVVVADLNGNSVATVRERVRTSIGRSGRLAATRDAVNQSLERAGIDRDALQSVAVGTPGIIEDDGQVAICRVLPEWSAFSLLAEMNELFSCPVHVENDTNLSALAEQWRGAVQGVDDLVWILTGRRTSTGILIGGRLHRGHHGAAGEIGWHHELGWASLRNNILSFTGAHGTAKGRAAKQVLAAASDGDATALELVNDFADIIASGVAAVALLLNPQAVVLGGGVAEAGDVLVPAIHDRIVEQCLRPPEVLASALGDESVALGAVRLALQDVESKMFSLDTAVNRVAYVDR